MVLWDTTVFRTGDMTQTAQAPLLEYDVHRGDPSPLRYRVVAYFISPGDAQDEPQAAHVEGVKSSSLLRAQSP